jgi:hypothetical protein
MVDIVLFIGGINHENTVPGKPGNQSRKKYYYHGEHGGHREAIFAAEDAEKELSAKGAKKAGTFGRLTFCTA